MKVQTTLYRNTGNTSHYSENVTVTLPVTAGTLATTATAVDEATALAIALG